MDWRDELEQHVNDVAYQEVSDHNGHNGHGHGNHHTHGQLEFKKETNSDSTINALLFVAILCLVSLIVFIAVKEKGWRISPPLASSEPQFVEPQPAPIIPPATTQPPIDPPTIDPILPEVPESDSLTWHTEKLTLIGMVLNHNTAVAKLNQPKSRYILIYPDWTIDKMPDNLELTEKDREFLGRHMRSGDPVIHGGCIHDRK